MKNTRAIFVAVLALMLIFGFKNIKFTPYISNVTAVKSGVDAAWVTAYLSAISPVTEHTFIQINYNTSITGPLTTYADLAIPAGNISASVMVRAVNFQYMTSYTWYSFGVYE